MIGETIMKIFEVEPSVKITHTCSVGEDLINDTDNHKEFRGKGSYPVQNTYLRTDKGIWLLILSGGIQKRIEDEVAKDLEAQFQVKQQRQKESDNWITNKAIERKREDLLYDTKDIRSFIVFSSIIVLIILALFSLFVIATKQEFGIVFVTAAYSILGPGIFYLGTKTRIDHLDNLIKRHIQTNEE